VAMGLSALFLVSYVTYHFATEPTRFGGEGAVKIIYLILLITHIITAAIILPFILFTFIRGYAMQVEAHKRIAKWTFPIWLYVAITGPICYLMLMPYY
jgi:putative membrane protein